MKEIIYTCDVCGKKMNESSPYEVNMSIYKTNEKIVSCWLEVCDECLKETGFEPSHGNSTNNERRTEKGYIIWSKWFKKR